ncbi:YtxH domain-containing protein [Candidatus Saccharibacteria bacterium]|nr:YtxH domain-containing protein [Candidatus Saccharibacteria bacterium]
MNKETKKFAIGALFAGVVGYLTGILTAPKSGEETRQEVKNSAIKVRLEAEKELKTLHSESVKYIDRARKAAAQLKEDHGAEFEDAVDNIVQAKEKARELLTALHEGDAEDKDLKKAIKDINNAIDHIKGYIKK